MARENVVQGSEANKSFWSLDFAILSSLRNGWQKFGKQIREKRKRKLHTGETAKTLDTGETAKTLDTGETAKTLDTGETAKTLDTGETAKTLDTGETAKTPEAAVSLRRLGARFGDPSKLVDLSDKSTARKTRGILGARYDDPSELVDLSDKSMARKIRVGGMNTNQSFLTGQYEDGLLIPELLNDIVLYEIIPKLSWKAFHVLSLVNRGWKRAVHSHPLYHGKELFKIPPTYIFCGRLLRGCDARKDYSSFLSMVEMKSVWRSLDPSRREYLKQLFSSQGTTHLMSNNPGRTRYYGSEPSKYCGRTRYYGSEPRKYCGRYCRPHVCTDLHSFLFAAIGSEDFAHFYIHATRLINADLFVVVGVSFFSYNPGYKTCAVRPIYVLRSKGFGSLEREEIIWEKINPSVTGYNMVGAFESF